MEFHPLANMFPMLGDKELSDLTDDIRANGLHEPIWTFEGKILDGRNRFCACTAAGVQPAFRAYAGDQPTAFVLSLNLHRRHLTYDQLVGLAMKIRPALAIEAEKRMLAGRPIDPETKTTQGAGRSAEQAAKSVGVGQTAVKEMTAAAKNDPLIADKLLSGEMTVREVRTNQNRQAREQERIAAAAIPLPNQTYRCLVIDPPWQIEKITREVRPNQSVMDYPMMSEDELRKMPIADLAAPDCHLYLWVTHKYLPLGLRLIESWGFRYQCLMTWNKNVGFTPFSWMYSTEHVLFCRRGSLDLLQLGRRLDFTAQVREHSRKPQVFYDLVRDVSPGPRLDMFAREPHDGFETWGNDTSRFETAQEAVYGNGLEG